MATIAREILEQFAWICQTPHPPGKEAALRGRIIDRLRGLGLNPWTDARGNLACDLPASPGCIQGPLTAVQAHLDMVCAAGSAAYVPERDPIKPIERDGFLCTAGESSLGADCGAGAAVMLWLAEHPDLPHPPLRLLFTVEEEIGLRGAQEMDPTCVAGVRYLINTDGFRWGRIVTGSAGGVREHYTHTLDWAAPLSGARAWKVQVSGLRGGHSGFDIGAGRANALRLLGEVLRRVRAQVPLALYKFSGGTAFNAIPYEAAAGVVACDAQVRTLLEQAGAQALGTCRGTDPDGVLPAGPCRIAADDLAGKPVRFAHGTVAVQERALGRCVHAADHRIQVQLVVLRIDVPQVGRVRHRARGMAGKHAVGKIPQGTEQAVCLLGSPNRLRQWHFRDREHAIRVGPAAGT